MSNCSALTRLTKYSHQSYSSLLSPDLMVVLSQCWDRLLRQMNLWKIENILSSLGVELKFQWYSNHLSSEKKIGFFQNLQLPLYLNIGRKMDHTHITIPRTIISEYFWMISLLRCQTQIVIVKNDALGILCVPLWRIGFIPLKNWIKSASHIWIILRELMVSSGLLPHSLPFPWFF